MRALVLVPALVSSLALASSAYAVTLDPCPPANGIIHAVDTNNPTICVLPPDGQLNVVQVTVEAGATLIFQRNARNTPIEIHATGDILIKEFGEISVDGDAGNTEGLRVGGRGGPGGFDGGDCPPPTLAGMGGEGPGGGGIGSHGSHSYGTALFMPLIGGSGGGSSDGSTGGGGGGGGGALLLESKTMVHVLGTVAARGGSGGPGAGYGGGGEIRIVAPVVTGTGVVTTPSPSGYNGRVRVDTIEMTSVAGLQFPSDSFYVLGTLMVTSLANPPKIRILNVGGVAIDQQADGDVQSVLFPLDSQPTVVPVTISVENLSGIVPITVKLLPEHDVQPTTLDLSINTAVSSQIVVNMSFPQNIRTRIEAWTR